MVEYKNHGPANTADEIGNLFNISTHNTYHQTLVVKSPTSTPDHNSSPIVCKRPVGIVSTYINRDKLQAQIRDALCTPQCPNVEFSFSLVNLHGIGGNGKSQLAKKVFSLFENCNDFNGKLIWLDAGKQDVLYHQFVSLVSKKGNLADTARLLYTEILKDQEFLIIFDNVVDLSMVAEYLPVNGMNLNAKVLLTSKKPWDIGEKGTIHNVPVEVFHPDEVRKFVCQFTDTVTEAQLVEICKTTSRIPADLSLICHCYRYLKEEFTESYSWAEHLKHYGKVLSTQEAPKDHLPGVEGVDYSFSTKKNVELSMNLLESVNKFNAGPFAVFILKNFAFCYGEEISRNEFAYRMPAFRLRSIHCHLPGSVEMKINYGLSLLSRFGFIEAPDGQDDDVIFHIHQSYQCALQILTLEERRKRVKFYRKPKDEWKNILIGLIEWAQLQEPFHDAFVQQKFIHMSSFLIYMNEDPELVSATTKTRDFLMMACTGNSGGDYDTIKLIKKYCKRNFVAMLLDNTNEDKSIWYCPALQRTVYKSDFSTLFELVLIVSAELNRIQKVKRSSSLPFKRLLRSITKEKAKSIQLTEEYIQHQMLRIAFMSVDFPAFEVIYSNFPLAFTWPLPAKDYRTLLQGFILMTRKFEADAAVVEQLQAIINLDERYNYNTHNSVKENYLNNKDDIGDTALNYAVHKGSPALVNALLESSACAGIESDNGFTPLDYAVGHPGVLIEEMMSERFDLLDPEYVEDLVKMCKLRKAYPAADILKDSPYTQQIFTEYVELTDTLLENYGAIVELILTKGKGIGINQIQNALVKALHPKALINVETIASLLSAGADANYEPTNYFRPLSSALRHTPPSLDIVKLLLDRGANPLLTDFSGKDSMFWLERWRDSDNFIMDAEKHYEDMEKLLIAKAEEMKR